MPNQNESHTSYKKPPLGLRPYWISIPLRIREILEAMQRYANEDKPIPIIWIIELKEQTELYDRLNTKKSESNVS